MSKKLKSLSPVAAATTCCASFTPGPWRVGFDGYTIRQDIGPHGGYYIASTSANYPERMPDNINQRDKANARLIAAAPELLDAMMAIEERYIDGCDTYEDWKFMGDTARAALQFLHNSLYS